MGMRTMIGVWVLGVSWLFAMPSVWAADPGTAEAAPVATSDTTLEQIRDAIDAETDPELKQEMEEQLRLLESGQLDLHTLHQERELASGAPPAPQELPGGGLVGPPVDIGTGSQGGSLPPEVRTQLERLFEEKGTGDPANDAHVREEAERILREHGIEPREVWRDRDVPEGEWRGEGVERAVEQMAPEAREQMEQFFNEHEAGEQPQMDRETFEREFGAYEAPTHEYEAPTHEYEAPTHEYEAQTHEYQAPEHQME